MSFTMTRLIRPALMSASICNAAGHRQAEKQRLGAVQQALVIHHPAKALLRHAHRFQHGKLPAAQADIRGDRIEYIAVAINGN